MQVLAARFDLHIPHSQSLKDKRRVLRPVIDGISNRFGVSVAEVAHQDTWQRSSVGVAVVSETATTASGVMDDIDRFVWSFPELDVLDTTRCWLEVLRD